MGVACRGLWDACVWLATTGWDPGLCVRGSGVESPAVDGDSPVPEDMWLGCVRIFPSSSGLVESAVNLPGPPGKPEYLA